MNTTPLRMPALVTPFDAAGDLDASAHRDNVGYLAERGLDGIVLAGSTGEGPYLEPGERALLVSSARAVAPALTLICGINAETLRSAAAQMAEAADGGADAVLVITPTTMVRERDREVERFYLDVAEMAPLPVYLYTVPRVTGYVLPVDVIARLSAHERIVGLKDSGGDPTRIAALSGNVQEPFTMYIGASRAVLAGIDAGAHGAITASSNYAWALVGDLVSAARAGNGQASELQATLDEVTSRIEPFGLAATKAAAAVAGLSPGLARRPLLPLDEETASAVAAALEDAGLGTLTGAGAER